MDITKTTINIIQINGQAVDFDNLLDQLHMHTDKIATLTMQQADLQTSLTTEQATVDALMSNARAIYAEFPNDVPEEVVDAFGLNQS